MTGLTLWTVVLLMLGSACLSGAHHMKAMTSLLREPNGCAWAIFHLFTYFVKTIVDCAARLSSHFFRKPFGLVHNSDLQARGLLVPDPQAKLTKLAAAIFIVCMPSHNN
jgi:hypothetical protein